MSAYISDNKVEVQIPANRKWARMSVKTGSSATQYVTFSGDVSKDLSGAGEDNQIALIPLSDSDSDSDTKLTVKFEYESGGKRTASRVVKSGPHDLGNTKIMLLAAENGDDADYNDCVVQFMWGT